MAELRNYMCWLAFLRDKSSYCFGGSEKTVMVFRISFPGFYLLVIYLLCCDGIGAATVFLEFLLIDV